MHSWRKVIVSQWIQHFPKNLRMPFQYLYEKQDAAGSHRLVYYHYHLISVSGMT